MLKGPRSLEDVLHLMWGALVPEGRLHENRGGLFGRIRQQSRWGAVPHRLPHRSSFDLDLECGDPSGSCRHQTFDVFDSFKGFKLLRCISKKHQFLHRAAHGLLIWGIGQFG